MHGKPKILGTTSQILHNNWKLYFENVQDTYHASLLHTFFTTFRICAADLGRRRRRSPRTGRITRATRCNKVDRVDQATSDQLYAGIPSLRENFRLADPGFLTMVEEIGDDTTTQILIALPEFRIAADPEQHCIAAGAAERAGQDRAAMDLYRLRGRRCPR